jgi:hypothetical protein
MMPRGIPASGHVAERHVAINTLARILGPPRSTDKKKGIEAIDSWCRLRRIKANLPGVVEVTGAVPGHDGRLPIVNLEAFVGNKQDRHILLRRFLA